MFARRMRAELVRLYREQPAYLVAAITHQVGQEITKRNVSIQPTLTIRARLPDAGNGEQGSDHAAVPAAVLPEGIVAMSMSTSKLRLGPLPKTETVKVTIDAHHLVEGRFGTLCRAACTDLRRAD